MSDGLRFGVLLGLMTGLTIAGPFEKEAAAGMAVFTVLYVLWLVVRLMKKQ